MEKLFFCKTNKRLDRPNHHSKTKNRTYHALFTRLLLVKEGRISLEIGHTEVELLPCSVLAVTPGDGAEIKAVSPEFDAAVELQQFHAVEHAQLYAVGVVV